MKTFDDIVHFGGFGIFDFSFFGFRFLVFVGFFLSLLSLAQPDRAIERHFKRSGTELVEL